MSTQKYVTFKRLQALGALAVDLETFDAAVEHMMNFGRSLLVTDLNGCEHLLLCRRALPVSVAGVVWWSLLLGLSSLICSSVQLGVRAEMVVQATASARRLWTSAFGRTNVEVVRSCDSTSHFTDDPLQLPQLIAAQAHLIVNEIVDLVDVTVNSLGVLVECRDLLDDLGEASAVPFNNFILRSDSLRKVSILARDDQHTVRQIRNLVLPLTSRLWACWGQWRTGFTSPVPRASVTPRRDRPR